MGIQGSLLGVVWKAGAAPRPRGLTGGTGEGKSCFSKALLYRNGVWNTAMTETPAQELKLIYTHLALSLCWYKGLPKAEANQDHFLVVSDQVTV